MTHPPLPSRIGKSTRTRRIDGTPLHYTVEDEVSFVAPSNPGKAFYLHKLRFEDGRVEFRICYYMIAYKPRMKGKWAFGQFAPMMTGEEMAMLFRRAQEKGWLNVEADWSAGQTPPPSG
jgi:hypothetical protein